MTDIAKIAPKTFAVSTSRGQIWIADLNQREQKEFEVLYFQQNIQNADLWTARNINSIDVLLSVKNRNSGVEYALHPNQIQDDEDQGVTEWLIGGD